MLRRSLPLLAAHAFTFLTAVLFPAMAHAAQPTATAFTITRNGSPVSAITAGQAVTLTATVHSGNGVAFPGQVRFCDSTAAHCMDAHLLRAAQVTSAGVATVTFIAPPGIHSYDAIFDTTTKFEGSSSSAVKLSVAAVGISATHLSARVDGNGYLATAEVAGLRSSTPPTGTVQFQDTSNGNATIGSATLGSSVAAYDIVGGSSVPATSINADLNHDGLLDFISETSAPGNGTLVQARLTSADGSTRPAQGIVIPGMFQTLIAGDFNNDGEVDLAVITQDGTLAVLLGVGNGQFTAGPSMKLGNALPQRQLLVADFNRDGNLDIALGSPQILFGNGDGTFILGPPADRDSIGHDFFLGDFNGDGLPDLVLGGGDETDKDGLVEINRGDGTFTTYDLYPVPDTFSVGDVNNDGKTDIAGFNFVFPFTGDPTSTFILLSRGNGSFFLDANFIDSYAISLVDIDGDGNLDIINQTRDGYRSLLLGNNDGTFRDANIGVAPLFDVPFDASQQVVFNGAPASRVVAQIASATTTGVLPSGPGVHLVDAVFSGDAAHTGSVSNTVPLLSLMPTQLSLVPTVRGTPVTTVAAGTAVTLKVTARQQDGAIVPRGTVFFCVDNQACDSTHPFATTQLNSAGVATLVVIPAAPKQAYRAVYVGTTVNPTAESPLVQVLVTAASNPVPTVTSLAVKGAPGDFTLTATVENPGLNAFPTGTVNFVNTSDENSVIGTANVGTAHTLERLENGPSLAGSYALDQYLGTPLADFDRDGRLDLAVASGQSIVLLHGNGDGSFTRTASTFVGQTIPSLVTADVNNDGIPDLVSTTNGLTILLGKGDGTFTFVTHPASEVTFGGNVFATGDFNQDGTIDIVVTDFGSSVQVLFGKGDGTFTVGPTSHVSFDTDLQFIQVRVADLNGDGFPDVVIVGADQYQGAPFVVSTLLGDGQGNLALKDTHMLNGLVPFSFQIGDLNKDGIPDLLVGGEVLHGIGDGTFSEGPFDPRLSLSGPQLADFNGDGTLDIAGIGPDGFSILLGDPNGSGAFSLAASTIPAAGYFTVSAAGDLNGDGLPDLVAIKFNPSAVGSLLNLFNTTTDATLANVSVAGTGTQKIEAVYSGDARFAPSTSPTVDLPAQRVVTSLVLSASPSDTVQGVQVTLTATLMPASTVNHTTDGELIIFKTPFAALGSAVLQGGVAVLKVVLPLGTSNVQAVYAGEVYFAPSSSVPVPVTVVSKPTNATRTVVLLQSSSITVNENELVSALVTNATRRPVGTVRFTGTVGQVTINIGTAVVGPKGIASLIYKPTLVGRVVITAEFIPDDPRQFLGSVSDFGKTLDVLPLAPALSFSVPSHTFGDSVFFLDASSLSPAPISYSVVSGPATIFGQRIRLDGAGNITVQAIQAATGVYASATKQVTFAVFKATQTLDFTSPPSRATVGAGAIVLRALASSGLPVTFSVLSGPGVIHGDQLELTGPGVVVVSALQPGTKDYFASPKVNYRIDVNPAP